MVFIQLFFLFYLLYTANKYLIMKISSKEHRLLPVIISLAGLFNFYRVVECVTDVPEVFTLLEHLLVLQVIFAIIHYKKDFLRLKFFPGASILLFISLMAFDASLILQYKVNQNTDFLFHMFLTMYILVLIVMDIYIGIRIKLKKREKIIGHSIFASFVLVLISALATNPVNGGWSMILTPFALFLVEINLNLIMKSGYIVDSAYLLKEQMYDNSAIITFLFDEDGYLIDLNEAASIAFPDIKPSDKNDVGKCYDDELKKLLSKEDTDEIEIRGCIYRKHLAQEFYMKHLRGYILYLVDLTQEKQENQLMESLMQKAESATKMKSRFLASMSHELRSPLHAILGFCSVLNRQPDISDRYKSMLGNIQEAGNTLLRLVNSILDYSKMEAGKFELKSETYDFEKILLSIYKESIVNRKEKPIQISLHMETAYPRYLKGDELHVRDIVQNLMSNAVKYTDEGTIECHVACELEGKQRVKIHLTVSDTGVGISPEQLDVIFQEHTSFVGDKNVEGTGLGLPIVKQLCEMMDGEVSIQSCVNCGTKIQADFYQEYKEDATNEPKIIHEEDMDKMTDFEESLTQVNWSCPDAKALVVDDMAVNLELFREFADIWKLQLDTVMSGEEAVKKAEQNDYDIIFLDNMMPNMTGIDAAAIIRTFSNTPIFILTADISEETKAKSLENGATELIEKPLKLEELKRVLEKYIPHSKQVYGNTAHEFAAGKTQKKVLQTFVRETEAIRIQILNAWDKKDMELFRIKVHGLKGTSLGIGLQELSDKAEIMEMAAKTDHRLFIKRHIEEFNAAIIQTLSQIEVGEEKEEDSLPLSELSDSKETTFTKIKEAFDNYDINRIEEELDKVSQYKLEETELELVQKLKKLAEELEYEAGSNLTADSLDNMINTR